MSSDAVNESFKTSGDPRNGSPHTQSERREPPAERTSQPTSSRSGGAQKRRYALRKASSHRRSAVDQGFPSSGAVKGSFTASHTAPQPRQPDFASTGAGPRPDA